MLPLFSIPSPESSTIELGPLSIHFYGLTLLVAIAAAVAITGIRWTRRGGDWDLIFRVAVWGVASGIVGARLYHVVTSWDELPDEWWGPFAIWKGGLGVWGGIGLGCLVGAIVARRSGASVSKLADCVAPALLVAQGIGRFGNWWNQELFGGPTDLPWGLEIDPENRPIDHVDQETFHPTFLYEALWCFAAAGVLLLIERRFKGRIRPGGLFALYVLIYSVGRVWIETLRIDPSHEIGGVRLNVWVAGARDRALRRVLRLVAAQLEARGRRGPAAEGRDHGGAEEPVARDLPGRERCMHRKRSEGGVHAYSRRSRRGRSRARNRAARIRRWLGHRRLRAAPGRNVGRRDLEPDDLRQAARCHAARRSPARRRDLRRRRAMPRSASARETSEAGVYQADVVFPSEGDWRVTIHSGFGDSQVSYGPVRDRRARRGDGGSRELPVVGCRCSRVLALLGALALLVGEDGPAG